MPTEYTEAEIKKKRSIANKGNMKKYKRKNTRAVVRAQGLQEQANKLKLGG